MGAERRSPTLRAAAGLVRSCKGRTTGNAVGPNLNPAAAATRRADERDSDVSSSESVTLGRLTVKRASSLAALRLSAARGP